MSVLPNHLRPANLRRSRSVDIGEKERIKRSEKTQKSEDEKQNYPKKRPKKYRKNKNSKGYPASYPTLSKSNSDGYGYKKSTRSGATSAHSKTDDDKLFLEEREIMQQSRKKTWKKTGSSFLMALFTSISVLVLMIYLSKDVSDGVELDYRHAYTSVTHHKFSMMTDSLSCSRIIVKMSNIANGTEKVRMASILHTVCFGVMARLRNLTTEYKMNNGSSQMSVLSWGGVADQTAMNPGLIVRHSAAVSRMQFPQILQFGSSGNSLSTGFFSKSLAPDCRQLYGIINYAAGRKVSSRMPAEKKLFLHLFLQAMNATTNLCMKSPSSDSNNVMPIKVSNLPMYSSAEKYGTIQFVSSGPNTLGVIAQAAVFGTLVQVRRKNDMVNTKEKVDHLIAQTIIYTLDQFADYYQKNKDFPQNSEDLIRDLINGNTLFDTAKERSDVKFISDSITVNLLLMDARSGWPSVFHFSTTAPGKFHFSFRGNKTAEMVTTCQVIAIRDGVLWLTAAASGQKYLLEKVVTSLVHRMVFGADPLATIDREREYYDTWDQKIKNQKHDDSSMSTETLQFSEYNTVKDSFQSWMQPKPKWNLPTGI